MPTFLYLSNGVVLATGEPVFCDQKLKTSDRRLYLVLHRRAGREIMKL